jgi:fibro-slime domain-containing protein
MPGRIPASGSSNPGMKTGTFGLARRSAVLALALAACGSPVVSGAAPDRGAPLAPGDPAPLVPASLDAAAVQLPDATDSPAPSPSATCGRLVATVRDFKTSHPDFEKDALNYGILFPGLVKGDLGGDGKPVYAPAGATPTTTGGANFDQWYRDVPGVNQAFEVPLLLTEQSPGRFAYDSAAFFPVDGRGWPGDDRLGHNFSFTTELRTQFRYRGGEKFTFKGDDDVFVFVNHHLALDLGGMHGETSGTVDLDVQRTGLGLVVGQSYQLHVFHAERHTLASNFHIETSIECLTVSID